MSALATNTLPHRAGEFRQPLPSGGGLLLFVLLLRLPRGGKLLRAARAGVHESACQGFPSRQAWATAWLTSAAAVVSVLCFRPETLKHREPFSSDFRVATE
eukprot:7934045-Alexandrium_andersonii.AAC.1